MNTNKSYTLTQFMWIGLAFIISMVTSVVVPFPYSLVLIVVVFIFLGYCFSKKAVIGIRTTGKN
jgi:hypothetical protein